MLVPRRLPLGLQRVDISANCLTGTLPSFAFRSADMVADFSENFLSCCGVNFVGACCSGGSTNNKSEVK